jgi:hypothetical protein
MEGPGWTVLGGCEGVLGAGGSPALVHLNDVLVLWAPSPWIRAEKVTGRSEAAGGALPAFIACTCCCGWRGG